MTRPIVEVDRVEKRFPLKDSLIARLLGNEEYVRAVDGVSLSIDPGETLALVGESGSGKSTLANLVTGLHAPTSGTIRFDGEEVGVATRRDPEVLADIGMVFQNPKGSLDPRIDVENVIAEPLKARGWSRSEWKPKVEDLVDRVNLSPSYLARHPHELSGGEAQRVAIARAIALDPRVIVLDEPVSALDVSVQAKILNLLMELQADLDLTYLFIAHDLNVVEHIADRVAVMYLGNLMELAPTEALFAGSTHPYTETLLSAIPSVDPTREKDRVVLGDDVPSPVDPPSGCVFHTRCPLADERCVGEVPDPVTVGEATSWCHYARSFADDQTRLVEAASDD
ncbi:ABC transporter ATP-binding protein [Halorarum salinum]|uniref:ATP-binding cassette domain-containing protein n=1 Tax=Halorarum salinum TaxID=2743089 RepID=A0A7D5QJS8_9EURY|nr:oligopeptide/dipeptide ABC transporter ATP-binding protein [Halobaculum salinum]QLG63924.1 ATP-binding cassette domain-containing protein [Halobaculum salinum]